MRVLCNLNPAPLLAEEGVAFALWGISPLAGVGRVGASIPREVKKARLRPSIRAWDFLALALGVVAADHACPRSTSADGWTREIRLEVAVVEPQVWRLRRTMIEGALRFLTGDLWQVEFLGGGSAPPRLTRRTRQWRRPPDGDCVCLLSGGMDSLIGALDLVAVGRTPVLVSQTAQGDGAAQRLFANSIGPRLSHVQLNHDATPPGLSERSQRARSMVFLGLAAISASALPIYQRGGRVDLFVPENGFISLNIPLTPLRRGSLSTRTTHPFFMSAIQAVLDDLDIRVSIQNPYQFKTKGEMLAECADQAALRQLTFRSTSCGRFGRFGFRHCGRCVPCLVRRAGVARWGEPDSTAYVYGDLAIPDEQHRYFDDVKSVAYAAHLVAAIGVDAWAGSALSYAELGDVGPYADVASRGIEELRSFLASARAL